VEDNEENKLVRTQRHSKDLAVRWSLVALKKTESQEGHSLIG
jgi:hypothetical protein